MFGNKWEKRNPIWVKLQIKGVTTFKKTGKKETKQRFFTENGKNTYISRVALRTIVDGWKSRKNNGKSSAEIRERKTKKQ